ncbi:hypothetical protein C8R47DRAFT_1027161 [Mycena vitilis]|nr:hypothetical protein C8R47DRAFT_1027161 [Mycena vitilis]
MASQDNAQYIHLVVGNLIPLHVVLAACTWILHDYVVTLEDEIRYIWFQRRGFSKAMYFWIRYYGIAVLIFDVAQIHDFARPGIKSNELCLLIDPVTRVVGAVLLWSVEIIMQLRVYALYGCSKRVAVFNIILFIGSIIGFFAILLYNHSKRAAAIASVVRLPLPGCPTIHAGIEWALWVPATLYEGVLFGFALFKTIQSTVYVLTTDSKVSLYSLLLRANITYFFGIAALLVFNNLMVASLTHIPWFSYGPLHAAVGIMSTRMLIHLRKATADDVVSDCSLTTTDMDTLVFQRPGGVSGARDSVMGSTTSTQVDDELSGIIKFARLSYS